MRVTVQGLDHYRQLLCSRAPGANAPSLVRPRGTNREMPIEDPSGNLLIFAEPDSDD